MPMTLSQLWAWTGHAHRRGQMTRNRVSQRVNGLSVGHDAEGLE